MKTMNQVLKYSLLTIIYQQNSTAFYQYASRCVVYYNIFLDMFKVNQNPILQQNILYCHHLVINRIRLYHLIISISKPSFNFESNGNPVGVNFNKNCID